MLRAFFSDSNVVELDNDAPDAKFKEALDKVPGLDRLVSQHNIPEEDGAIYKELILHALAEFEVVGKDLLQKRITFSDPLSDILDDLSDSDM